MNARETQDYDGIANGVVQLRFSNDENSIKDINAAEFAEVLQGLVEFTSQLSKTGVFGDGFAPVVRVRPPVEGSFIVEALIQLYTSDPIATISLAGTAGGAFVQSLNVAVKKLRGEVVDTVQDLPDGYKRLNWRGGGVSEIPGEAWKQFKDIKRQTRRALAKIMAPLSDDLAQLEVRDGKFTDTSEEVLMTEPDVVMDRSDYYTAAVEPDDESTTFTEFETEAQLTSIDFRRGEKWRVKTPQRTRLATIEDEDFLVEVERGLPLHKNDIFNLKILETKTTKNGASATDWSITQVTFIRQGGDDGDDSNSPIAADPEA